MLNASAGGLGVVKVLHGINTLAAGGAELHLLTLCRFLKRLGIECAVAYLKEGRGSRPLKSDFEEAGIPVFYLKGDGVGLARAGFLLQNLLKQERPDILHTHLPRADLVGALVKAAGVRVPWVSSVHDIYSRSWRGKWSLPLFSLLWKRADAVIAISYAVRDWLVKERGVPAGKVRVVYYGIEPEKFDAPGESKPPKRDRTVIGTIGRLEPRKGHETIIRAMPLILTHYPGARLRIAGHDPWGYGRSLRTLIESFGLEGKVELLSFVEDIPSFLREIDVFAFASRSEGFGQVIIEAMAARRPVVASRIAPLSEIVVDGETGLLVPPDDPKAFAEAICRILADREQACQMGDHGHRRVREVFSADTMARKIMDIYVDVLRTYESIFNR